MKKLILWIFVIVLGLNLSAQDILQKTNKAKLEVKIIEIGPDEIKYKNYNDLEGPVYVIYRRDVTSIQLENGETIQFEKDILEVSASPNAHKKNAIMIDPFSPFVRHIGFGYQRWFQPGLILEAKAGIIGIGVNPNRFDNFKDEKKGAFLTIGNKMMFKQLTYSKGTRLVHPLAGAYFKPQISFSYFTNKELEYIYDTLTWVTTSYVVSKTHISAAFNLTIGKQWLIADVVLLDMFVGAGYGFANTKSNSIYNNLYEDTPSFYHSHLIVGGKNFPLTLTSGISLGVLIK